jgi:hypothetical protein
MRVGRNGKVSASARFQSWYRDTPYLMRANVAVEGETLVPGEPEPVFNLRVVGAKAASSSTY